MENVLQITQVYCIPTVIVYIESIITNMLMINDKDSMNEIEIRYVFGLTIKPINLM